MILRRTVLALLLAALPTATFADIRATYEKSDGKERMTVEIADNGDFRGDLPEPGVYSIVRGGQAYLIEEKDGTPTVMRAEDVATVLDDEMRKIPPPLRKMMSELFGSIELVENGTRTINGRTGAAWFMKGDGSAKPAVVISADPALMLLGTAMTRQFDLSLGLIEKALSGGPRTFKGMRAVLATGAPLLFAEAELKTVETTPIDPTRFTLPGNPANVETVRARLKASGMLKGAQ